MILMVILFAIIGAAVGSFVNVVSDRLPAGGSLVTPRSHCDGCGRPLTAADMLPIVSYLVLRGRCRKCGMRIPQRVLWVEIAGAALYAGLWLRFGLSIDLVGAMIFGAILLAIFVMDLEHKLVLNIVVLPSIALAVVWAVARAYLAEPPFAHYGLLGPLLVMGGMHGLTLSQISLLSQLGGGLLAFLIFFIIFMITPAGMGAGDVKLSALAGILTALPGAIVAVFGSFILGGVVSIALIVSGVAGRKSTIPFAPFLVVTTVAVMLFGDALLHGYLGF